MTNKAQVFLADSMASIAIFSFFVLAFGLVWNVSVEDATNQDNFKQAKGEYTLNILKSEGNPQNWNASTVQTPGVFEDGKLSRTKFLKLDKIPSPRLRDSLTSSQQFQIQAKYMNGTVLKEDGRNLTVRSTIRQQPDVNQDSLFSISTQNGFNKGSFDSTSADRDNNSGDLGIGYLNGTNSDQPNDVGLNNESLVGYWRLDREVSGSNEVLKDYSGLGNDGITKNGVSTGEEGVFSTNGIQVDGSEDYVDIGKPPELDLSSQRFSEGFTMSAWVKPQKVGDRIGFFTIADGVSGSQWQAYLAYSRNDERRFFFSTRTNGQSDIKSADLYPTNQWYFVTGVWNGQKDILYVNGEKQAEAAIGQPVNTDKNTVHIGRFPGFTQFNGSIDEVRLYNRSLSKSEIEDLYFQGRNGEFNGSYRSETFTRSQETDWSAFEVNASVPSDTDLTATFESLEQGPLQTAQSYASPSEWNLGSFNTTTADNVVVEKQNVSMLEASKPSEFNEGNFNQTTSFNSKPPLDKFETSSQTDFNGGTFKYTSADRGDNSGDLGIGYLNGTKSGQPENNGLNNKSMVGYWRLDKEVSDGETAVDYSGEDNDGSLNTGGNTASGSSGILSTKAFNFDGNDDYLSVPDSSSLDQGSALTVSFWMKADSYPNRWNAFIGKEDWNSGTGWVIYDDGGELYFEQAGGTGIEGSWSRNTGEWYHIVATSVDGGAAKIYVDGDQISSGSVPLSVNDAELNIGSRHQNSGTGSKDNIDGTMDEVRIYNRSLSQPEVEDLYFQGRNGEFTGSYTAKEIDKNQNTNWNKLEVNASIPSETSVNATFRALDTDGNLVDSQLIDLSEGLNNYSLSVSDSEDAEVFINGTSSNVTKSWEVHSLEVFSSEVEDKNEGLRIGYRNGSAGDDLVGYWRLDRNVSGSGGTVKDYSGQNNGGTTKGGVTAGADGTFSTAAMDFDGNDDYVEIDSSSSNLESWTVSGWIKLDDWSDSARKEWLSVSEDKTASKPLDFVHESGDIKHYRGDAAGEVMSHDVSTEQGWHYMAVTQTRTSDSNVDLAMYFDGSEVDTDSGGYENMRPSLDLSIGRIAGGNPDRFYWPGQVDEIRIYNDSLAQSEIDDLYFNGRNGDFNGNYTAKKIDNSQETKWGSLEVNASIPSDTSVNATFKALDATGGLVAEQDVDLGQGLNNYSLSVASSEDAEVVIDGTSSNVTKTWEVHSLEVYSTEVVDRNDGLRIGYRNGSVGDNLVGYWRLDRNVSGGGTVRDYSGYDSDGTGLNGVSTGKKGVFNTSSFAFDHSNRERISVPDISGLFDDEATVSLWLRRKNLNTPSDRGKTGIFRLGTGTRSHYPWKDGRLYLTTFSDSRVVDGFDDTGFDKTEWHHLVISTEPGTDEYVVYRNGDVLVERNGPSTVSLDNDDIRFGHSDNEYAFNGQMDEIRLYNRSLSTQKVRELYFNGRNGGFNGSYTAKKIDEAQETSWKKLNLNASVPSQTSVDARFNVLDSQGGLVESQVISLDDGRRNYSLDVKASKNARLNFNGTSSNATKTWKIQNFEVYSSEYQVKQSQNLNVLEGSNEYLLGVGQSKAARVGFKGSSTDVQETWSIESFSVLNTSSYGSTQTDLNLSKQESYNQGEFNGTSTDRRNNSGTLGIGYLNGTKSGQTNDYGLNNESLVGYWRLDRGVSGSGGTVKDYSGYGNNGKTQNGISSGSEGVFSTNSFQSEEGGDIEFVNVSDDTSLDITEEVTMSAWVNLESDASDFWRIVQKGQNTAYEIYMQSGDTYPVLRINNAINLDAPSIQTNNWTLVTATYDASTDNASIYLDGSLEATTVQDVGNIGSNNNPLRIGTREQKDTSIDGKIDEVRIYDRALSPNDIRDLYFNGKPFQGNYTAKRIDKNRETSWNNLEVDASVPSQTSVNVTFESLDSSNNVIGSQEIVIKDGLKNYSLQTGVSENAEVSVQGTSSDVTKTWEIRDIQVFGASKKSEERVSQIPENKSVRTFRSLALDAKTDKRVQLSFYRWSS